MHTEAALRAFQARQLGLISRDQALAIASRRLIERRLATGTWDRVLRGVYRDVLVPPSLQQSCLAAMLWAGSDPVVGRRAAGRSGGSTASPRRSRSSGFRDLRARVPTSSSSTAATSR